MAVRLALVVNRSGYDTEDLRRYFERAFRALGVRRPIRVYVTAAPRRSRGCADVGRRDCSARDGRGRRRCTVSGPRRMSIAIAAPSYSSHAEFERRLARLVIHETAHVEGMHHEQMPEALLYSEGPTPAWARGTRIRYRGRAPRQMPMLVGGSRGRFR